MNWLQTDLLFYSTVLFYWASTPHSLWTKFLLIMFYFNSLPKPFVSWDLIICTPHIRRVFQKPIPKHIFFEHYCLLTCKNTLYEVTKCLACQYLVLDVVSKSMMKYRATGKMTCPSNWKCPDSNILYLQPLNKRKSCPSISCVIWITITSFVLTSLDYLYI